ncbi:MAG: hypothetical protein OXP66_06935 [Candidatus Tectomicrobia bacterium]|nr:hypothetical protein [Candidatus Tectomicrobia bacterium]
MTVPKCVSEAADWAKKHKTQAVGLGAALMLLMVVVSLLPSRPSSSPQDLEVTEAAGGMLADLRGEDVLQRLRAGQAAMQQEMAWVRQRLAQGEGVSSTEADLARAVSEVQADRAELESFVRLLEVRQMRLQSMVIRYHIGLEALRERLDGLAPADEGT